MQLMWALKTEEKPPDEAFNPEVKRSGWQPPQDCGLWTVSGQLRQQVLQSLKPSSRAYWEAESTYFDQITSISGGSAGRNLHIYPPAPERGSHQSCGSLTADFNQRVCMQTP